MKYVMRVMGFANGQDCPIAGQYLEWFDFDQGWGRGYGEFTLDLARAKKFSSREEALTFWQTQSRAKPLRPNGKPNRPLTATTVLIEPVA